jgi:hypothetical protein
MNTLHKPTAVIILHSTAFYLLSYIIILFIYQLVTLLSAQFFDFPGIIHYNKIDFLVNTRSWTFESVKMIYSSGTITTLIIGLLCLVIYIKAMSLQGILKLFFFWGFVHGLNMFIGSVVIGAFFFEGMGYVLTWMYFRDTEKMFMLFLGLIIMLGTGTLMIKPMLLSANIYYSSSRPEMRKAFKREQFIFPYLISTVLLILLRLPLSMYELFLMITPVFILIPLLSGLHRFTIFFFDENERSGKLNIKVLLTTIVILILYRVLLENGLRMG